MNGLQLPENIDLLGVGAAASAILLIGVIAYLNNKNSATARAFFAFAVATVVWNLTNFFQYQFHTHDEILFALRINLFAAVWHAYAFFMLCYVFPNEKVPLPRWILYGITPAAALISILTLTPLVFNTIGEIAPVGRITQAVQGPGTPVFGIFAIGLLVAGLFILAQKRVRQADKEVSRQILYVLLGMLITAILILLCNVILPLTFSTVSFLPFTGIFMLPFIALISYATYRHKLFNMKALAVQALAFALSILTFAEVAVTRDPLLLLFRVALLIGIIAAGILLTRSVTKEIELRETIQKQEEDLEIANAQQVNLLHFISHEIKGYLTKGQNAFAGIMEGDYGMTSPEVKTLSEGALKEMRKGVDTVMGILDAANLKKGTVDYEKKPFDFKKVVLGIVEDLKKTATDKGLQFELSVAPTGSYFMTGDEEKMKKHVIRNLVDNAVRYTPKGSIKVVISDGDHRIHFSVHDSGVGITPEDMKRLFTEGGHGKESIKVNVDSTGYGLFIAKQVVDAHGGKIWAESDGAGKGSTFIVDLPGA